MLKARHNSYYLYYFLSAIKRDFLKHKILKTNDKIRRFGVVMTPLSRKNVWSCKLQHLKRYGAKIDMTRCEDYKNAFARIESDCTLRSGFKVLMKSISYNKQSNLFLHILSSSKCLSRSWGIVPCTFLQLLSACLLSAFWLQRLVSMLTQKQRLIFAGVVESNKSSF